MIGGSGDDTFTVNNVGDTVTEGVGGGTDLVNSSIDLILADNVENLVLTGAALIGTGNSLDNTITGTDGNNTLDGLGGDDVLIGLLGDDTYIFDTEDDFAVEAVGGGTDNVQSTATVASLGLNFENLTLLGGADINGGGNDVANIITGNSGANSLLGFGGNDLIDGGLGADFMNGGAGDDTFIVDNVFDLVTENSNQGLDTVQSSVSFNLSLNVENLLLVGMALNGSGNIGANLITGNDLGNTITGEAGNDVLRGADGDDDLDGGSGADEMEGGSGSDIYRVDNAGDTVIEQAGEQGIDRVAIEFGGGFNLFTLGAGVENADLVIDSGTVRGNAEDNNIEVTTGFVIIADGAGGNDQIIGSVNANRLLGGSGDDVLTGGGASDRIFGQAGDDIIRGGEGNDVMTGQSNADRYEFFAFSGLDLITDFDVSEDVIALDIDSIGIPDFSVLQFQIQDNGNGNAEIEIAAGTDVITLTGVSTAQLSAANFDFF
jgi:trimeric autotransporter adhesin